MAWRLMVRCGGSTAVRDLPDVEALRAAVMRLRQDPRVDSVKWLRIKPAVALRKQCRCGKPFTPGISARERLCRCGDTHVQYACSGCGRQAVEPPRGDECADLPVDTEGVSDRYSRKRWRRT